MSGGGTCSLALAAVLAAAACSGPDGDRRFEITGPSREAFAPAAGALLARCGSLDCHGAPERNLRVYGFKGLRIDAVSGNGSTTPEEYEATYQSLVAIEPEVLSRIVRENGARPERWIVFKKGRGTVHHKGRAAMHLGDPADACLAAWLAGSVPVETCLAGAEYDPPEPP